MASGKRVRARRPPRLATLAAVLALLSVGAAAAAFEGVSLPDTATFNGTQLRLNGIGLRTYSWLRIRIYVAGLYLERPSHDAEAILRSPEKKLLVVRFIHDVDAEDARKAWREGFQDNCLPPCHLAPADIARFLAAVPDMRSGDHSTLAFTSNAVAITLNGQTLGTISDPMFAHAVLAAFLGPHPPTAQLKRELLGLAE
ncbi:MAG: chalcone isomerase family protein [Alphaproteobacteria bacterium]|nr:chalcone isomerase family protein [Alphaproteobacteria bacterium]